MKRISDWWKKINTPFYKRTIESLQGDEKKDRRSGWFGFGITISIYFIVFLTVFVILGVMGFFLSSTVLWLNTKVIIISISLLTIVIFGMYLSQVALNAVGFSEINTALKHMTVQIKLLESGKKCNGLKQNQEKKTKEEKL